jgi:multidrug efflux pump subunit AcrA (membrane-fusion protein)
MQKKHTPVSLVLLMVSVIGGLGLLGIRLSAPQPPRPMAPEPPPAPVHVRRLVEEVRPRSVRLYGETAPIRQATLAAEQSGRVIWRSPQLEVGGKVEAGEELLRVDDTATRLQFQASKAVYEAGQAQLKFAEAERNKAQDGHARSIEQEVLAEVAWSRAKNLSQQGDVSLSFRDQAQQSYLTAVSARETWQHSLESAAASLTMATAQLRQADAQVAQAKDLWDKTMLRAPFSGEVSQPRVEVGDWVIPGAPVAQLMDRSVLKLPVSLPIEESLSPWKDFQATVSFLALKDTPLGDVRKAHVVGLAPIARSDSRARILLLSIPNGDIALPAGAFAEVLLNRGMEKSIWLRAAEFLPTERGPIAYVVEHGVASLRKLQLGRVLFDEEGHAWHPVREGLRGGETLAMSNLSVLSDGDAVKVLDSLAEIVPSARNPQ